MLIRPVDEDREKKGDFNLQIVLKRKEGGDCKERTPKELKHD